MVEKFDHKAYFESQRQFKLAEFESILQKNNIQVGQVRRFFASSTDPLRKLNGAKVRITRIDRENRRVLFEPTENNDLVILQNAKGLKKEVDISNNMMWVGFAEIIDQNGEEALEEAAVDQTSMVREQVGNIDSDSYSIGKFVMAKLGGIFGDSFRRAEIYEVNHATKKIKVYSYLMGRKVKSDLEIDFQDVREETPDERNSREGVEKDKISKEQERLESLQPEDRANFEFMYRMMKESGKAHDDTYSYLLKDFAQPDENSILNLQDKVRQLGQSDEEKSEIKKIIELLFKKSYENLAVRWLSSKDQELMKYDTESRLEKAQDSARKSGKTLEEIARAHGLEHLIK